MQERVFTPLSIAGIAVLLACMVGLWQRFISFPLPAQPFVLAGQPAQQALVPAETHDVILVLKDPERLGGIRASTSSLGSPHLLGQGQAVESQLEYKADEPSDCPFWFINNLVERDSSHNASVSAGSQLMIWPACNPTLLTLTLVQGCG